jgi:tripartite-type tricarboxylate transporter receptor subunit TctC
MPISFYSKDRRVAALAAAVATILLSALPAQAQQYPNKPIRIIVPFAAGGTSDILARAIGPHITLAWGQPVIVENRTGANGNVGADFVAKSAPDGYTMLLSDVGALSINPSVYPDMPFDPARDFSPIVMVSYSPHVLAVHPSVPVNNVKELIAYAHANPGKLNFANSGTGGAPHLAGVEFAARTGVLWTYIPYKGGSAAVLDVVAGNANVLFNGMLATYPSVKAGRLKGLAVSSAQRVPSAPELPTVAETLPGFETGSYQGLLAAAGTPREIVMKLNAEVTRILNTGDMKEFLAKQGTEGRAGTPEALGVFIVNEKARWAKVVKDAGVKAD